MKPRRLCALFLLLMIVSFVQAQQQRPKIGLTLSGGGAKGLAHIGILKAIDSAGLHIDYVTGTSMGSIIGALYAIGYSGDSIEQLTKHIDWDLMLSNQYPLRDIIMPEKSEYNKYTLELPWVNHWFRLSTGVLEAQELWIKFSELFFPVYRIKRFDQFAIPFKCIGTDISNGEAVAMDSGEIASAVRASMAIPSIFTAVQYDGKKLVDGGVVRNFPVRDVKEMGADIVIGSNVSNGLLEADKVNNVIQVLLQIAFFKEAEDTKTEIPLCDIYVPARLGKYSMGSFSSAPEILEAGLEEGRKLYPRLKKLADSLDAIYGPLPKSPKKLPHETRVKITDMVVMGNKHTTRDFLVQSTGFTNNRYYTPAQLAHLVRRAAGTRYYSRITYALEPLTDSTAQLRFDVTDNPVTFAKIGLNYNQYTGISAILNLTTRDFFTPNSRSLVTVNLGQNFLARAEHLQYFGRSRNISMALSPQFEQLNLTTYRDAKEAELYTQQYFRGDLHFGFSTNRDFTLGFGSRFEWIKYIPSLTAGADIRGSNQFMTSYLFLRQNTLDKVFYPRRGFKLDAEGGLVYAQYPRAALHANERITDTAITSDPYTRVWLNMENYFPLGRFTTLQLHLQSGIEFNYQKSLMNEFSIGGLTNTFHNQVLFAGLRENGYYSTSLASLELAIRYQILNNLYAYGRIDGMWNNFVDKSRLLSGPDLLSGYALTLSYNFALGPLEMSVMYCDQWKRVLGYINIGIPF